MLYIFNIEKEVLQMKKRHLLFFALIAVILVFALCGCGADNQDIEGKNVVTFELNGGTLDYKTSSTKTKINFAYHPGTYIVDPTEIPNYQLYRNGYNFTGWYTDKDCTSSRKWDFKTPFNQESLTLYAGWEKAILYTYSVYYVDGDNDVLLGSYKVSAGDSFDDWRGFASKRDGYTATGYFSDRELSTAWDSATKHPGGDADKDIPVYVDYIEGVWELVDNFTQLSNAIKKNKNVYLTADIDCGGAEFYFKDAFGAIIEGNGHQVSNFKVCESGTLFTARCSIFTTLNETAEIRNISFVNVNYSFFGVTANTVMVSALALKSMGATVENVSISGTFNTDSTVDASQINKAFYEVEGEEKISGFTANITIGSQN